MLNITLRQLRAFAAVAENGHFARAAERLHVTPSGLSMLVRELEGQLGVRLLFGTTRVVRLTEAGIEFLPLAQKVLADLESAVAASRSLAELRRGRVSIAASIVVSATLLPWALRGFVARHPGIRCVLRDGLEEDIRDQVRRGDVDLGVGTLLDAEPGLAQLTLLEDQLVALVGDGHPLAARRTLTWRDLARYPVIALTPRSPSRALADAAFRAAGIAPTPAYEASFSSTVISMVAAGLGVAALPLNVRQVARRVKVHARKLVPATARRLGVFWRDDAELSPAAAAFRSHLADFVRAGRGPLAVPLER